MPTRSICLMMLSLFDSNKDLDASAASYPPIDFSHTIPYHTIPYHTVRFNEYG